MGPAPRDCVLCGLVAGRLPASVVHRDDDIIVLMDIQPVTAGHLMVIPTAHVPRLADLSQEVGSLMFEWARIVSIALYQSALQPGGLNLFLSDGEIAMQEIDHLHLHLIPRYKDDGFGLVMPNINKQFPERAELDRHADFIRSYVDSKSEA